MNLSNLYTQISFRLGNRKGMEPQILAELNLAQLRLERDPSVDWWFLLKRVTLDVEEGVSSIILPADYIRLAEQSVPLLCSTEGAALGKLARAYHEDAVLADVAAPAYYVLEGDSLKVYPSPSMPYKLDIQYVAKEPALSDSVLENQWTSFAYALLMCKAGIALSQGIQFKEALANFSADFAAAYKEAFVETVARSDLTFSQVRE